jgi:hypothetical protein
MPACGERVIEVATALDREVAAEVLVGLIHRAGIGSHLLRSAHDQLHGTAKPIAMCRPRKPGTPKSIGTTPYIAPPSSPERTVRTSEMTSRKSPTRVSRDFQISDFKKSDWRVRSRTASADQHSVALRRVDEGPPSPLSGARARRLVDEPHAPRLHCRAAAPSRRRAA